MQGFYLDSLHNKKEAVVPDHHSLPYPVRTLAPAFSLVDRAREIAEASHFLETTTNGKLKVIAEQMRALREQAEQILTQAERDAQLHRLPCAFEKKAGMELFLYRKPDQTLYFSLLAPADWKGKPPHEFVAGYRLLADQSFEELNE